jgi:hypothetical protein
VKGDSRLNCAVTITQLGPECHDLGGYSAMLLTSCIAECKRLRRCPPTQAARYQNPSCSHTIISGARPKQLVIAVLTARHDCNFAPSPRLRFCLRLRLPHGQDRALDFGLDPGIFVNGHMIEADVAAEIDVRQLAAIAGIGSYGRAPTR